MVTVRRAATRLTPSAHKPPSGDVTTEAEGLRLPAGETGAGGIHNDSRGTYRDYISLHRRLIIMGWSPVKLASFNRLCVSSSSSALCSFIPSPPGSRNHYRATGRIDGSETTKRNVLSKKELVRLLDCSGASPSVTRLHGVLDVLLGCNCPSPDVPQSNGASRQLVSSHDGRHSKALIPVQRLTHNILCSAPPSQRR